MNECIERNDLIKNLNTFAPECYNALINDLIMKQPAADVAPVKSGFWEPISESEMTGFNPKFAGRDPIAGYKCSNCGNEAIFSCNDEFVLSDYCPNCGAKMDF